MGIADRDYLRVGPRSRSGLGRFALLSVNSWIIIINILVFVADPLLGRLFPVPTVVSYVVQPGRHTNVAVVGEPIPPRPPLNAVYTHTFVNRDTGQPIGVQYTQILSPLQSWGHFSTARAFFAVVGNNINMGLEVWRFITFQFLHGGVMHIALNMLGLWVFGGLVEQQLGRRRYLAFYLMCGLSGAALYLILNFLGSQLGFRIPFVLTGDPYAPLVGASAGVFGVIVAAARIAPNELVQLIFPPIPVKMKIMATIYVAIAAINLFNSGKNAGGDAAHIGGAIAGFYFVRRSHLLRDFLDVLGPSDEPRREDEDRADVDRILAKVSQKGLSSLNAEERQTLQRASERQRARSST